ncbi:MAG: hypothetical protein ACJ0GF_06485 [Burkholderiales bacterium]|nr:MAG: hypothetical protein CBB82_01265 [Betaproteobacteria bacterium TMED22]|tara:strand:- start:11443 stop:11898 length:456 start_codon:yes stop_codon:yes gene_type:complete
MKQSIWMSAAISGLLFFSSTAFAAKCDGNWSNVGDIGETVDLGGGVTFTIWRAAGTTSSANSPMNGAGHCGGYIVAFPDGTSKLSYACARKDKDGGIHVDAGGMEPGDERGTWGTVFGSGNFENFEGAGTWAPIFANGNVTLGEFVGECSN